MSENSVNNADIEIGDDLVRVRARGKFRDKDAMDFVPTAESALLLIDTPNYDGPLDLLLHLIKKHSLDIFDIPLVLITQKYLEALDEMTKNNFDVAAEFLLMAATLTELKSKMLLPKEERKIEETDESEGEDPRRELMKRLLLYKAYKEAGEFLLSRPTLGQEIFLRQGSDPLENELENNPDAQEVAPFEIYQLIETLSAVIKLREHHVVHTINRDRISVSSRIHELIDFCQIRKQFTFYEALRFFPLYDKVDIIVSFLALLEMSRLKLIRILKDDNEALLIRVVKENFYSNKDSIISNFEKLENIE
jgi:segregation and condensation protein A